MEQSAVNSKRHFTSFMISGTAVLFILCLVFPVGFSYALEDAQVLKAKKLAQELAQELKVANKAKDEVAEEHYQKGIAFYNNKDYLKAVEEFELVLKIVPGYKKAESYIQDSRSQKETADSEFRSGLIRQKQKEAEAISAKAMKHYYAGQFKEALDSFNKALEIDPANKTALNYGDYVSKKLESKRNLWAKIETRKRARETEKESQEYLDKGLQYYKEGLYEQAIGEWEKILPLVDPSSFMCRKTQVLIAEAKTNLFELKDKEAGLKKEIDKKSALLDSDRQWVLPQYLQVKAKEIKAEKKTEEPGAKRRLAEQAKQIVSLDFDEAHLREVLTYLSQVSGVNIVLDETIFPEEGESVAAAVPAPKIKEIEKGFNIKEIAGIEEEPAAVTVTATDPRVTIHLKNIPLIDALDIILRTKGLKYRLEENVIWITTPEQLADTNMVTKIYRLSTGVGAAGIAEEKTTIETGVEVEE